MGMDTVRTIEGMVSVGYSAGCTASTIERPHDQHTTRYLSNAHRLDRHCQSVHPLADNRSANGPFLVRSSCKRWCLASVLSPKPATRNFSKLLPTLASRFLLKIWPPALMSAPPTACTRCSKPLSDTLSAPTRTRSCCSTASVRSPFRIARRLPCPMVLPPCDRGAVPRTVTSLPRSTPTCAIPGARGRCTPTAPRRSPNDKRISVAACPERGSVIVRDLGYFHLG